MNSHQTLPNNIFNEGTQRLRRIWQEPLTFIILVWALMLVLVGVCFTLMD